MEETLIAEISKLKNTLEYNIQKLREEKGELEYKYNKILKYYGIIGFILSFLIGYLVINNQYNKLRLDETYSWVIGVLTGVFFFVISVIVEHIVYKYAGGMTNLDGKIAANKDCLGTLKNILPDENNYK